MTIVNQLLQLTGLVAGSVYIGWIMRQVDARGQVRGLELFAFRCSLLCVALNLLGVWAWP